MAERRMFSKSVTDSDSFLDMSATAQLLYFHLSMHADDDGFLKNPKSIMRMVGGNNDDLNLLVAKQFLIPFESGVVVIKHWKIHNYIRSDRYSPSTCEEKEMVTLEKGVYNLDTTGIPSGYQMDTTGIPSGYQMDTTGIPSGYQMDTQDRLGKDRLGKDRLGKDRLGKDRLNNTGITNVIPRTTESGTQKKYDSIKDAWNTLSDLGIKPIRSIDGKRKESVQARIKQYGEDGILEAIANIRASDFLQGKGGKGWVITFDWFIKPNNFPKVLEGNYENNENKSARFVNDVNRTRQSQFEYLMQSIREDEESERN